MRPHVSVITLGVSDLVRAREFYAERLGWRIHQEEENWVCFLLGGGSTAFALYPRDALAADARADPAGSGFRGITLAYVVHSQGRVDEVPRRSRARRRHDRQAGPARGVGGYSGYFADPEGYLWEVASGASKLPFAE